MRLSTGALLSCSHAALLLPLPPSSPPAMPSSSPFSSVNRIHLDTLTFHDGLSHTSSYGANNPTLDHKERLEQERQQTPYRPRARFAISWAKVEDVVWATIPLVFMVVGFALLAGAMFQQSISYLSIIERTGRGRLDYGVLGASSSPRCPSPR